ncbi:MAB_1171c family putative transporter [Streptomyces sp. NPDC048258]|uniref:MAB_1171c family putative transporter n=1 Tax=Streptomyces sp. NPDC048258 TaxID=3365527 RepID=UPI0037249CD9
MLLFNLVYGVLAVISWSAFVYKLRDLLRDRGNPDLRLLCLAIATFATPFVVAAPWVYVRIDRLLGITNIATLITYTSVAICLASFLALLVRWSSAQDRVRLWHRVLVAYAVTSVGSMITLFVLGDVSDGEHHVDFDVHYAETPYITQFLLIYALLFVVGMTGLMNMCWRYAKAVDRPWLRRGLRVVAAGAVFGLGYGIPKVVSLTWDLVGTSPLHFVSVVVAPMSASVSAWLFAVGFTMPAWGVGLDSARARIIHYRAYRRLHPLWAALTEAFPEVVLFPDLHPKSPRRAFTDDDLSFLVGRLTVEILDGQLALLPYIDPAVARNMREVSAAKGISADETEALVEAAQIRAGLQALKEGGDIRHAAAVPPDPAAGDMRVERKRLMRVADAFRRRDLLAEAARA